MALGLSAAIMMTLSMVVVRAAELSRLNLEMMYGAMLTQSVGPLTWAIGVAVHLVAGILFALIYALIFEAWGGAGWFRGLLVSLVHVLVAGTLLAALPVVHPAIPEHPLLRAPGFMASAYGAATIGVFLGMHLLFGLIVGGGYRVHAPARRAPMSHGPA